MTSRRHYPPKAGWTRRLEALCCGDCCQRSPVGTLLHQRFAGLNHLQHEHGSGGMEGCPAAAGGANCHHWRTSLGAGERCKRSQSCQRDCKFQLAQVSISIHPPTQNIRVENCVTAWYESAFRDQAQAVPRQENASKPQRPHMQNRAVPKIGPKRQTQHPSTSIPHERQTKKAPRRKSAMVSSTAQL